MGTTDRLSAGDEWDAFWRDGADAAVSGARGAVVAGLPDFWRRTLSEAPALDGSALDLACGAGVVAREIRSIRQDADITVLDISPAAVRAAAGETRARGVVASAASPPFRDGSFEVVVSQFGLEYAGLDAFDAAARLLAPGGLLAVVLHCADGAIQRECRRNLEAARAVADADALSSVVEAFRIASGASGRTDLNAAMARNRRELATGAEALKAARERFGEDAAGALARRVFDDIAKLFGNMRSYAVSDVESWADGMRAQIDQYVARMAAMVGAALSKDDLQTAAELLRRRGALIADGSPAPLLDQGEPVAWTLVARKPLR